jgi:hypothetical protein
MPLRKPAKSHDDRKRGNKAATKLPFPPEAHKYDSDVTDKVVGRAQAEADKVLNEDKWDIIDGDKR